MALGVDDFVELFARVEEVLERNRSFGRRDDVYVLLLCSAAKAGESANASKEGKSDAPHPVGELFRVRNRSREEDDVDVIGKHDDDFFPDHTALWECRSS